jgi:ABC-type ATPase with predicted acetyltransferase domain
VPFEAGVTAIAEMKSGAVQAISGVGNPPVTEAIGNGTGVTVVMGWGFDDDQLLVPASVTLPAQLAGKSVGVLVGSSEDYELLGYLALEHLTGKVKVVPFSDETAAGAAALSGAVDAAYVYGSPATAFPHELSGGMQHRAAFARALAARPSLLLMDEPFGALDAITRERMHEFLLDIREQHRTTIIFVTHDIEEAILLGDRVAVMGGRPPGIGEVIDIPLARPRHALDTDTEAFLTAKRRIRAALRS